MMLHGKYSEEIIFIDCVFDNTRHEQIDVDNEQE